ncbi:hypothetical protein B0A48_08030 [Cryoendolithus antarcticus]|uniref:Uncharacterized protein n=1 Tax=Cryoendolithus antarcticus TaxID=1507870 RepID=A0A1V8T107_9PEZI|nr:hypothetical protein B0A48_08030 [Cryoendolithus antarcticus]
MDSTQVAQSYLAFAALVGGLGGYYYYTHQRQQPKGKRRGSVEPTRAKGDRRASLQRDAGEASSSGKEAKGGDAKASKKRKAGKKPVQAMQPEEPRAVSVADDKPEKESDISIAQFAQQMTKARQGAGLSTAKGSKDSRVRTVKQNHSSKNAPVADQVSEADDHLSSRDASSPALQAGDVSDMMEPKASGPKALRLTASTGPEKSRAPKEVKEQQVETKKQRQNRQKVEQRKLEREAEEADRKALAERQRRSAREARGEPAKNGVPVAPAPANNPWAASNAAGATATQSAGLTNGGPMLDTFDAEDTSSDDGAKQPSTAPSSTTEGNGAESEEQQVARAVKESEDVSGWTTVGEVKRGKGKVSETSAAPVVKENAKPKTTVSSAPTAKGKGFEVLGGGDLDASNPEAWTA